LPSCSFLTPSPLSRQVVSLSQSSCVAGQAYYRKRGRGCGGEPNHTTAKNLALYNHSILSGFIGQEGGREGQLFKYIQEKENNIILLSKQEQGMIRIICFVASANKWANKGSFDSSQKSDWSTYGWAAHIYLQ
jgi:hypothetical protein